MLLPTSLVGSYCQPEWLIDRTQLAGRFVPRTLAKELWRVPEEYLASAQDDATYQAIKLQEEAGLDIITDGEIRRESYSNRFANALDGLDLDNPGTVDITTRTEKLGTPICSRIQTITDIPIQPGHDRQRGSRNREQDVLIRGVL